MQPRLNIFKIFSIITMIFLLASCDIKLTNSTSLEATNSQNSLTDSSIDNSDDSSSKIASSFTSEDIANLVAAIDRYFIYEVVADLDLFVVHPLYPDYDIIWESSHPQFIDDDGKYTRPAQDTIVTLHYMIFNNRKKVYEGDKEFCAKGAFPTLEFIDNWLQGYNFDIPNPLSFPVSVRTTMVGYSNVAVAWSSLNENALTIEDNYLMPKSSDVIQDVTVKASVTIEELTFTRNINLTIPVKDQLIPQYGPLYHGLPIMTITTNDKKLPTSSTLYSTGTFQMSASQAYPNSSAIQEVPMQIRVRGNATSAPDKKPYRIKFDNKISLFGMGACKNWVLLADYYDETYLREAVPKMLANSLDGMAFNSRYYHVEVYINGAYRGLYLLTDQIQINESRVNIYESDTEVDTGYLFEWDWKKDDTDIENVNYFYASALGGAGNMVQMVGPEALSTAQKNFLLEYINMTINKLKGDKVSVSTYKDNFDLNAAIDYMIVNEVFKNQDIWGLSVFMYKDKGGPLTFGPVWDFHLSAGNCNYANRGIPNSWHTVMQDQNQWFYRLMVNDEFRELFKARWNEIVNTKLKDMMDFIRTRQELITEAAYASNVKWKTIRSTLPPLVAAMNLTTYEQFVDYYYDWVNASIYYINNEVNKSDFTQSNYRNNFNFNYDEALVRAKEKPLSELPVYF